MQPEITVVSSPSYVIRPTKQDADGLTLVFCPACGDWHGVAADGEVQCDLARAAQDWLAANIGRLDPTWSPSV